MKKQLIYLLGMAFFLWECKDERIEIQYEEAELFMNASTLDIGNYTDGKLKWQNDYSLSIFTETENKSFTPVIYKLSSFNISRILASPPNSNYPSSVFDYTEDMNLTIINPASNSSYLKQYDPNKLSKNQFIADTIKGILGCSYSINNYDSIMARYVLDTNRNDNYVRIEQYDKESNTITGTFNLTFKSSPQQRFGGQYGALLPPEVSFRNARFRSYFKRVPKKM
jgi:hypothetical protein